MSVFVRTLVYAVRTAAQSVVGASNGSVAAPRARANASESSSVDPLSFMLSFHTLIALSASVAWQSLLLTLTSIDGHLHRPLISRVDVRLSPFLSCHTNLHHHILFHL